MDLLLLVTFSVSFGSSAHKLRIWFFPSCLLPEAACKLGLFWELLVQGHWRANSRRPVIVLREKTCLGEAWPIVQSPRTCKSCAQFPSLLQFPSISSGKSLLPPCYSSLPVKWGEHQVLSHSLIGEWNSLKWWRLVQQMCWFWGCLLVRMLRLFYHKSSWVCRLVQGEAEVKNHPEWGKAVEGGMDLGNPEM